MNDPMKPSNCTQEIDVRGLPPPQPMARILEAATLLKPGDSLVVYHDRVPRLLYPRLEERGLLEKTEAKEGGLIRLTITRPPV